MHRREPQGSRDATVPAERPSAVAPAGDNPPYLLVFERNTSWVFPLPRSGEVVVGRADNADLRLEDGSVSRQHARITTSVGEAKLADINSQNGTFLNGERLVGTGTLVSGDTIGVCGVTLVFHSETHVLALRAIADFPTFRQRAEHEIERSHRSRRAWTLAAFSLGTGVSDRARAGAAISSHLRRIDLATWDGADRLLVLLAET